jgi:hypothetical protein
MASRGKSDRGLVEAAGILELANKAYFLYAKHLRRKKPNSSKWCFRTAG